MSKVRFWCPFVYFECHLQSASFYQVNGKDEATKMILDDKMWSDMLCIVCALFPAIIVLRLADSNKPTMDRLYYHVHLLDRCLQKSKTLLDEFEEHYKNNHDEGYLAIVGGSAKELCHDGVNDDSDDEELVDYSSTDDDDESVDDNEETLGDALMRFWDQQKTKLTHDFSISGWMLSPIPKVYEDAKKNQDGNVHQVPMEQLFKKMFYHEAHDDDEFARICDLFWSEYEGFLGKSGVYGGHQPYIWNSSNEINGNSYLWHKKYSVPYTRYLDWFACHVCSKILGIGSAK